MKLSVFTFLLSFLFLPGTGNLHAQGLTDFDPNESPDAFTAALEPFMTDSKNKVAQDAYANFNGVFYGGGLTEDQQKRVAALSVRLANERISPQTGFTNYFSALEQLSGTSEEKVALFTEYHDAAEALMAQDKVALNTLLKFFAATNTYLSTGRLDSDAKGSGWEVIGGKPHFAYSGETASLRIDSVRYLLAIGDEDSVRIEETELVVDLLEGTATGRGGRTDWQRQGLSEEVFAILVRYDIDLRRTIYTADSAQLQYPEYFGDKILIGKFTDKVQPGGVRSGSEYPQFISDDGFVEIDNVGEGIDLLGNFELRGNKVYAIGDQNRRAQVTLAISSAEDTPKVRASAERFVINQGERVAAKSASAAVYFESDSLYHPSVTLKVDIAERTLTLTRTESSADQGPFFHSLNNLNIYADHIDIFMDQDSAVVGKKTVSFQEKSPVVFESKDYYNDGAYARYQSISERNPLEVIYAYRNSSEGGNDIIDAETLAKKFSSRFGARELEPLLYELQADGFLLYDKERQEVTINDKIGHYVESSREEIDYDRLRLISDTKDINAYMDLRTGQIRVEDVKPIEFNRKKQIALRPLGDQLTIQGDRDFDFSGEVIAGGMVMTGKDFHFRYQPYYLELDSVRYLDLYLPEEDVIGEGMNRLSTGSRIEHLSGYLLIDAPKNKSGTEDIAYFPSLQSKEVSYIYYDKADTNAVYDRDSFYFELQPFSLNGMDSLISSMVQLDGRLNSGGIFPDMEETLSIQEDGSLGFVTNTEELGQGAYGERGNYAGEVILNNRGLAGKGKLTYLEAEIESEDLKFQLDRTTASARQFNLEETVQGDREVPQVRGTEVNVLFKPYGDSLVVNSVEEAPFELYKAGGHTFTGGLVLTPGSLKGNGRLDWDAAAMSSKDMSFTTFGADADTANVQIRSLEGDDRLALKTTNVSGSVDFTTQVGSFQNNSNELSTELPYNQFSTSIDKFNWDMAGGSITFQAQPGKDRFTSIHPDQDELTFTGTAAVYDLNSSMLDVDGVPFVTSADARIYPGDEKIRVEPGAKITELTDARIVADTVNEYHVINRATVQIKGRKEYTASGFYEYNVGPYQQEVELQEIIGSRVGKGKKNEKATATRATGTIDEATTFYVDDKTRFFGEMRLDAGSKKLYFDGYAKLDIEKIPNTQWFTVASEGDKKNLTLDISGPKDREGLPLFTGLYLSKPSRNIYPSFIQTLDFRKDHPILDANGVFTYREGENKFLFGDSMRVNNPAETMGNLMVLDNAKGTVSGDGVLGLGGRLKYVSVKAYGTIEMDLPEESRIAVAVEPDPVPVDKKDEEEKDGSEPANNMFILLDEAEQEKAAEDTAAVSLTIDASLGAPYPDVLVKAMTAIDMILPDKLYNILATDLTSSGFAAPGLNLVTDQEFYRTGIKTLFPEDTKERQAALAGILAGAIDVPKKINQHSFLFSQLKMKWSNDYQSFVTTEKLNGLASVKGNPINRMLESYVEIKMPTGGDDRIYLYLKSPSELYYFLGFQDGILNVVTNNQQFMTELEGMKAKELVLKMDDGETYEILPVSPGTAQTFLRRAQAAF